MEAGVIKTDPFTLDKRRYARLHSELVRQKLTALVAGMGAISWFAMVFLVRTTVLFSTIIVMVAISLGLISHQFKLRRLLDSPDYKLAFEEQTVTFSPEGIEFEFENGLTSDFPWETIGSVRMVSNFYVLGIKPGQDVIVPDDVFASSADEEIVRGYMREKITRATGI